jgi:large subunit ribosomal protein L24
MARGRMQIRKGDVVEVISGKERGKRGTVLEADPRRRRIIIENLNVSKKHQRPKPMRDSSRMGQQQIEPGGVVDIAAPISVSNVKLVCPSCDRPTRVAHGIEEIKGTDTKIRVCGRSDCGKGVDR